MDFYYLWNETKKLGISEISFHHDFLRKTEQSLDTMRYGTDEELLIMCKLLLDTKIEDLVNSIQFVAVDVLSSDVIQFSNFNDALDEVCKIIRNSEVEINYDNLGQLLVGAKNDIANKKYGENHSKLAAEFSFIRFEKKKHFIIENTSFGNFSLHLSHDERYELARRLLLRNPFVQHLIIEAKKGECDYQNAAQMVISGSTITRRKSNIKRIMEIIFTGTKCINIYNNIFW